MQIFTASGLAAFFFVSFSFGSRIQQRPRVNGEKSVTLLQTLQHACKDVTLKDFLAEDGRDTQGDCTVL